MNMASAGTMRMALLHVSEAAGLHARPAALLVKLAQGFDSAIEVSRDGRKASAKSITGILMLGVDCGSEVVVTAEGRDADEAMAAIEELFACGFHERLLVNVESGAFARTRIPRGRGELILVADDEPGIRQMIGTLLDRNGYRVMPAQDGLEAVLLFADNHEHIHAVMLDALLPLMNGVETARAIRRINPRVPVLAMSGSLDGPFVPEDRITAFLRKPFGMVEMLLTLRALLDDGNSARAGVGL